MISRGMLALIAYFSHAAGAPLALADSKRHVDTITIQDDGTVTWNLIPLKNRRELVERLHRARSRNSEVRIVATQNAPYGAVAPVMATAQRESNVSIGLVTTQTLK